MAHVGAESRDLAIAIVELAQDFDAYDFMDSFEDEQDALYRVEDMLTEGDIVTQVESLIDFCEQVLDSEDDTLYEKAEYIIKELQDIIEEIEKVPEIY